eukprot:3305984-Prymnesium_polylepis.1
MVSIGERPEQFGTHSYSVQDWRGNRPLRSWGRHHGHPYDGPLVVRYLQALCARLLQSDDRLVAQGRVDC